MRVDAAAALLRRCNSPDALLQGRQIHVSIASTGLDRNTFIANLLIQMYSACGSIREVEAVFHAGTAPRNVYSWTIALQGFASAGYLVRARDIFSRMPQTTIVSWNVLIAGCGAADDVYQFKQLFDRMPERDLVSWNTIIAAYARSGHMLRALCSFQSMNLEGLAPDSISFISVLDAMAGVEELDIGFTREITSEAFRMGINSEVAVGTALITVFGKVGEIDRCEFCYNQIVSRNMISGNAMLTAYTQCGHYHDAKQFFDRMCRVDAISCTTMITAYSYEFLIEEAKFIFDVMPRRDLAAWNAALSAFAVNGFGKQAMDFYSMSPTHDILSRTSMIIAYGSSSDIDSVLNLFEATTYRDATMWNAVITALAQNGHYKKALDYFDSMDLSKNKLTYLIAIDACGSLGDPNRCDHIFQSIQATRSLRSDSSVSCSLIRMLGRSGLVSKAEEIVANSNYKTELCNAMILAYTINDQLHEAMLLFETMPRRDLSSWIIIVRAYAQQGLLDRASSLFALAPQVTTTAYNAIISSHLQRGHLSAARKIFDSMEHKDLTSWNSIISAYAHLGYYDESLALFRQTDTAPDRATFLAALEACYTQSDCRDVHEAAIDTGWINDLAVATSLVATYGRSKAIDDARSVFDRIQQPSIVSWNCLLKSYVQSGHLSIAREMIQRVIPGPDAVSFNTLAAGYLQHGSIDRSLEILEKKMPCWDCYSRNTAMVAYAQAGDIGRAKEVFASIEEPSTVSWNTIACALVQAGDFESAARLFSAMDLEGIRADKVSFLGVLDALGRLTAIRRGKIVHAEIDRSKLRLDVTINNALVNFYGRCGCREGAFAVFEAMVTRQDVVSWNGIVAVFANNGVVDGTFELVSTMTLEGICPDDVSYVSVLAVCSHAGLIERAGASFQSLVSDHLISPKLEHFMCIVDLLCRIGHLDEAQELVDCMPVEPNSVAYMTLLGACRTHGNSDVGSLVVPKVAEASAYILASQICVE